MVSTGAVVGAFKDFTQDVFLKLFVTQLQNQNPMEPMDNYEFTSQLAQMGQLEQLTNMTSKFEAFLRFQEFGYASSLIGAQVTYMAEGSDQAQTGTVTGVRLDDGEVKLVIGTDVVPLESVTGITKPAAVPTGSTVQ